MAFLSIQNVSKQYSNHLALDNVSMEIPEQSIYGLLGPNGAGKTTLIRIINQITAPDKGSVFFKGNKLSSKDIYNIGYLPEERGLYKKMKVGEQALYLAQLKGLSKQEAMKRLKFWFEKFEIEGWWSKKVEELSKGMAQKVQFITTVLHEPELIIFDEPFSGFDPVNTQLLKREILELQKKGSTIIFSTHNMESVEELCENISLINKSKVILQGNIDEIRGRNKTQSYKIVIKGSYEKNNDLSFQTISSEEKNNKSTLRIKTESLKNNELLKLFMKNYHILSFEEELPSMNDIFINAVKEKLP